MEGYSVSYVPLLLKEIGSPRMRRLKASRLGAAAALAYYELRVAFADAVSNGWDLSREDVEAMAPSWGMAPAEAVEAVDAMAEVGYVEWADWQNGSVVMRDVLEWWAATSKKRAAGVKGGKASGDARRKSKGEADA